MSIEMNVSCDRCSKTLEWIVAESNVHLCCRTVSVEVCQLKLHAIVCQVIARECYHAAAHSPNVVSLTVMPSGLHSVPDDLRRKVQDEIDNASGAGNDYILLGYGLCSRGTAGLEVRDTPIVIPRMHDCITMLLGSDQRYGEEFRANSGTYYFSSGWIEWMDTANQGAFQGLNSKPYDERLREYTAKYGDDNALYLLEQESSWLEQYSRAAFINLPLGDIEGYRTFTRRFADSHSLSYAEIPGDLRLADKLFSGEWDASEFLIVNPGEHTIESVNNGIISACKNE